MRVLKLTRAFAILCTLGSAFYVFEAWSSATSASAFNSGKWASWITVGSVLVWGYTDKVINRREPKTSSPGFNQEMVK